MRLRLQHPMCCSACASLTTNWCLNPRRRCNRCRYEKIGVPFLLSALRSFARAIFCSFRIRHIDVKRFLFNGCESVGNRLTCLDSVLLFGNHPVKDPTDCNVIDYH
jgi:hypothetical protein